MRRLACVLVLLAACTSAPPGGGTATTEVANTSAAAGLRVVTEKEGGLGGLWIRRAVDGDALTYVATTHRICSVPQCQAAIDSASGKISAESARAIAEAANRAAFWQLRSDYGRTPNSADMFTHVVRVQAPGRAKTVTGDDGSLPEAARAVEEAVERAVSAARAGS